jgi:hypothetical protein
MAGCSGRSSDQAWEVHYCTEKTAWCARILMAPQQQLNSAGFAQQGLWL